MLTRVPPRLAVEYEVEVLVLDDSSPDRTFEQAKDSQRQGAIPFPLHVLFNPVNQGYGGNQKIGYHFALERGFDFVALVHGDGQYAPECLPDLVAPLCDGRADAVFGSRMLEKGGARTGGMPFYKFVGNRILSWFQNRMLGTSLSEFHSGYRVYSVQALAKVPFELNTNDFHFDTEIIVQFVLSGLAIVELPIPTYYGDEICRVNGLKYAWDVTKAVLVARAQQLGLFYDRRFDCSAPVGNAQYEPKFDYVSPHSTALEMVADEARVLDLGCAGGYVGAMLRRQRRCRVTGVDKFPLGPGVELDAFVHHDLNEGFPPVRASDFDHVLPRCDRTPRVTGSVHRAMRQALSTRRPPNCGEMANIGFFVNRRMLLLGEFNYGKRGIPDLTHTRLFTFHSFAVRAGRFRVVTTRGFRTVSLALRNKSLSRFVMRVNQCLIAVAPFSPTRCSSRTAAALARYLLEKADEQSAIRSGVEERPRPALG